MRYESLQFGNSEDALSEELPPAKDLLAESFLQQLMTSLGDQPETPMGDYEDEPADELIDPEESEEAFAQDSEAQAIGPYAGDEENPFDEAAPTFDNKSLDASNRLLKELAAPTLNSIGQGNYPAPGGDIFSDDLLTKLRRLVRKL